jgi:hypothetical protein
MGYPLPYIIVSIKQSGVAAAGDIEPMRPILFTFARGQVLVRAKTAPHCHGADLQIEGTFVLIPRNQIELSEEVRDIGPLEKPDSGLQRLQNASRSGKFTQIEQRFSVRSRQGGGAAFATGLVKSINFLENFVVETQAR